MFFLDRLFHPISHSVYLQAPVFQVWKECKIRALLYSSQFILPHNQPIKTLLICYTATIMPKPSPISLFSLSSITVLFSRASTTLKINTNIFQVNRDKLKQQFSFSVCKLCSLQPPNLQSYPAELSPEFKRSVQFRCVDSASYLLTEMCVVFVSSFDSIISLIYFHNTLQKLLFNYDNLEILFDSSFLS